jgi:nucleotide-binding universal stress UspA family protein
VSDEPTARCVGVAWDGTPASVDAEAIGLLVGEAFGLPIARLHVDRGDVVEGLIAQARACGAAYVCVGGTHRGALGRIAPGSTAIRLVRRGVAVIVPPRGYAIGTPADLRVIAAGYDGTPPSRVAVDRAADLADRAGATLRIRAIAQSAVPEADPVAGAAGAERLRELVESLPRRIRPDGRIVPGEAASSLLEESERGVDMLFVGSHRYGPLLTGMLGSVSDAICERGHVPVAIVPAGIER